MNSVRIALDQEFVSRHPESYFEHASNPTAPYIVYEFYLTDDGTGRQLIFIDVDGWDTKEDTSELESMMSAVDLNKCMIETDDVIIVLERTMRKPMDEDDGQIKRRRYSYEGIVYERSE